MREIDFNIPCWFECKAKQEKPSCKEVCQIYLKMNYFMVNCGMPYAEKYLKQLSCTQEDVQTFKDLSEIKSNIVDFVEKGDNLFITSKIMQCGKTTWSLKIMYRYFFEVWNGSPFIPRGYFLYVPEFLQKLRSYEYKNTAEFKEVDKILKTVDLVIWDDITANILTQGEQALLNSYISKRIMENKSNIFNGLTRSNYKLYIGETLTHRLAAATTKVIKGVPKSA